MHKKMKFSIKDFFIKCDQIRRKLRIWSHLLKKSLMENLIFCALSQKKIRNGVCFLSLQALYQAYEMIEKELHNYCTLGKCLKYSKELVFRTLGNWCVWRGIKRQVLLFKQIYVQSQWYRLHPIDIFMFTIKIKNNRWIY